MKENIIIAVDIETTGLDPSKDKIIELGGVKIVDGQVTESFSRLINPNVKLSGKIISLTGITDEMLCDAPEVSQVLEEFLEFSKEYTLLGHNILFDYSFLKTHYKRIGVEYNRQGIDTLRLCRVLHPELKSRSLEYMRSVYNISAQQAHRAYADAQATYILYEHLHNKFFVQNPDIFQTQELIYKVKKESPITDKQKKYLNDLIKYHKIEFGNSILELTKSEASKIIDQIIYTHGRI